MSVLTQHNGVRAVFLDLNGTLVEPVQPTALAEYTLLPRAAAAVQLLTSAGFVCPVITVQTRIAKGLFSEAAFRAWFTALQASIARQGACLVGPYLCPHRASASCLCAKPQPTLYRHAARDHVIDCRRSYVVGDTVGDIRAAAALGATGCLVLTGWGPDQVEQLGEEAAFVGADLFAVAEWIVAESTRHPAQETVFRPRPT